MWIKDLTNQVFGRLKVVALSHIDGIGHTHWVCQCKCGNMLIIASSSLVRKLTQSCGCIHKEVVRLSGKLSTKHGLYKSRFYRLWSGMKNRCLYLGNPSYEDYGGRGIKVCDRWLDFINFRDDMYESYLKHVKEFGEKNTSLDRFPDINGNYEPTNVRWATLKEQGQTRRDTCLTKNHKEHNFWRNKLSQHLCQALRGNYKTSPTLHFYLGSTLQDFRHYIESLFLPGMTFDNHGKGPGTWQLDHIIGCNNFDLSKKEDRKECWNYTNIRPLWDKDHKKKSKRRIIREKVL